MTNAPPPLVEVLEACGDGMFRIRESEFLLVAHRSRTSAPGVVPPPSIRIFWLVPPFQP